MNVISLIGEQGKFETSSIGQPRGTRTFGLWSFAEPKEGDLVVIQRSGYKVCYEIVGPAVSTFTGSNQDRWWTGVMRDIHELNLVTEDKIAAIEQAGLA